MLIVLVAGVVIIVSVDNDSYEEQLSLYSNDEWKGYYELTVNGSTTHENLVGGCPDNLTIKRQNGDKLVVYVNSTFNNPSGNLIIKLIEDNQIYC
ncbi:hypothetical protein ALNOE001_06490 [Candidatus Methanobinarius endosymbioticus]|uniref:Uncharacterized protein n=1 Tax=Candidatus Methanobinarius endosymbioticus TaxID=2006182 RepID=A0A366MCS5_9EURY|nr:hypothetical protein ALNOE001_06490 [Candidatus Methanobinarius endosymbioticus]